MTAQFSTAQPYKLQLGMFLGLGLVGVLVVAASISLIAGFAVKWNSHVIQLPKLSSWMLGVSLGGFTAGVAALGSVGASRAPVWANYSSLGTYVPIIDTVLDTVVGFLTQSTITLFLFAAIQHFTDGWIKRRALFGPALVLLGLVIAGSRSIETISSWLLVGFTLGFLFFVSYLLVLRFSTPVILIAVGVTHILSVLRQGFYGSYPGAVLGGTAAAIVTGIAMYYWYGHISRKLPEASGTA
jgi:hypothetical protein